MGDYSLFEKVIQMDWLYVIGALLLLALLVIALNKVIEGIAYILKKWFGLNVSTKQQRDHALLLSTCQSVEKLSEKHRMDMEESNKSDAEIKDKLQKFIGTMQESLTDIHNSQKETNASITALSEQFTSMEENTNRRFAEEDAKKNKQKRAELKDKISQSYRYYHERQEINDIEFETLNDLIKAYESCGGDNSFVHSVVQKEMYTWEQVQRK